MLYYLADDVIINLDHVEYFVVADTRIYFHMFDEREFVRQYDSKEEAEEEFHGIYLRWENED